MRFAERFASKLDRFGEEYSLSGDTYLGMFKLLDIGNMSLYLDDIERMGVTHPALLLATKPDVSIGIGDTITRSGQNYTVLKTAIHYIAGIAIVRIAILNQSH
ncbi:MAG: hypothetical protein ACOX3G_05280 [Armatimonadota bacterium]|jgi:hypothetical protein